MTHRYHHTGEPRKYEVPFNDFASSLWIFLCLIRGSLSGYDSMACREMYLNIVFFPLLELSLS